MTMDDDVRGLAEISRELPALDLDAITAERIARRVRDDVGKSPSPRRFLEPAIATLVVGSYLVWAVLKVVELLG